MTTPPDDETTFPMRVAARLAGVTPERLRAWETRHAAIVPARSPGGSRRYSSADLERIRALRRAVESGRRIAEVAGIETAELLASLDGAEASDARPSLFERARESILGFDAEGLRTLLVGEADRVGRVEFAKGPAMAFAAEVGQRWADGELPVACEHFATEVLRSLLLDALGEIEGDARGPRVLFATTSGEDHDLGLLVAAVVAADLGASVVFVGADVPEEDLVHVLSFGRVDAVALGFVMQTPERVEACLRSLRERLPDRLAIWAGGRGIGRVAPGPGVDRVPNFERLRAFVLAARASEDLASGLVEAS